MSDRVITLISIFSFVFLIGLFSCISHFFCRSIRICIFWAGICGALASTLLKLVGIIFTEHFEPFFLLALPSSFFLGWVLSLVVLILLYLYRKKKLKREQI
jgi:hypothetical protein